ncbi:cytochrome c [Fulvivirgaceae bacterium PWU5]|uniref:Cytochrome c n=1 Tax=Dawidia cretensis TaxID=2782350 RepID=A0AAP2E1K5_9BACT|nr:cytochrome c [Dawidia cretensis]MBT1709942.1 cytochrome c [Dawidia cretensis]
MNKVITTALVLTAGITFFSFKQSASTRNNVATGKEIYEAQCMSCHMDQGQGLEGVYPPLAKSDYLADKDRLVKVIRKGMRGPITVNGVQYDGEMTGFELTDQETADVINYIRTSWGNKHAAVKAADVPAALNKASKDYQPY